MTVTLVRPSRLDRLPDLTRASPDGRGPQRGTAEWTALVALIAALIFQPILHPTGPGNSSPVDLLLVATILTGAIWARSGHHKLRAPYFIPVALMVAAGAASGIVSSLPGLALTTLATDILLFAWCTAIVNLLSSPRAMRYAVVAWSWAGIFWATVVVVAWLGHITSLEGLQAAEGNRVLFTFGDPNYAATYWVATIFVVYASRAPTARWMRFTGYIMLAWALALSESNGGVLALWRRHPLPAVAQGLSKARAGRISGRGARRHTRRRRSPHGFSAEQDQAGRSQQRPAALGELRRPQRTKHFRAERIGRGAAPALPAERWRSRPRSDEHQAASHEPTRPVPKRGSQRLLGHADRTRRGGSSRPPPAHRDGRTLGSASWSAETSQLGLPRRCLVRRASSPVCWPSASSPTTRKFSTSVSCGRCSASWQSSARTQSARC